MADRMPKFRTMLVDTPAVATHLMKNPDAYLTPIGSFLRKFSLDDQASFREWLMQNIEELYKFADAHDARGIREKLKEIVPEYEPQDSECVI